MEVYLKTPTIEQLHYRQEWLNDIDTMRYNAGYDLEVNGYDYNTGTIKKSGKEMIMWYNNWINKEPKKYFAYIYDKQLDVPVGEVYFYYQEDLKKYCVGILISNDYRGKGYGYKGLLEIEKIAFEKYKIPELIDVVPYDRISAIKTLKRAGFIELKSEKYEEKFKEKVKLKELLITREMYQNKSNKKII